MERITFEGNFCDISMCRENPCPYNGMCSQRQTWERLKEYEETGLEPMAMATGGGTYAKVLKQGVAFGASFPDDEDLAHQAGEYATVSGLLKAAKVYANALVRLCAE